MKQVPIKKKISGSNNKPEAKVMETIGYALVDDQHYLELNQYTWTLHSKGYAKRYEGRKQIYMHTDIWCRLEGRPQIMLDHINRDKLNNQLSNFRPATDSQSQANKGLHPNSTTGFKGVSWFDRQKKYTAQIGVNRKIVFLGYFYTSIEAAKAYDIAAIKYFGEFAVTNQSLGLLEEVE